MRPVTIIGGVNVDINCFSRDPLNMGDSNPGRVEYCPGGVGRNIAENLVRLGVPVRLISVIGDDPGGALIRASSEEAGLDISHSLFLRGVTPVYAAIMDSSGEMKLALADMSLLDEMSEAHLESKADIIRESAVVALDTNLSEGIIRFVLDRFCPDGGDGTNRKEAETGETPLFFLDPVSARKAPRAADLIGRFHTLKLGRMEAAVLSGVEIPGPAVKPAAAEPDKASGCPAELRDKLEEAARRLTGRGARRIFITLGKEGVFCARKDGGFFIPVRPIKPVNTSGGGDAFMAGAIYGTLRGWDDEVAAAFAAAMAEAAVMSSRTVSPDISVDLAEKIKEYHERVS